MSDTYVWVTDTVTQSEGKLRTEICFVSSLKDILVINLSKAHSSDFVRISVSTETLVAEHTQDFVRQDSKNTWVNTECESLFVTGNISWHNIF